MKCGSAGQGGSRAEFRTVQKLQGCDPVSRWVRWLGGVEVGHDERAGNDHACPMI